MAEDAEDLAEDAEDLDEDAVDLAEDATELAEMAMDTKKDHSSQEIVTSAVNVDTRQCTVISGIMTRSNVISLHKSTKR